MRVLGERMTPSQKRLRQRVGFLSDSPAFPPDFTAIGYLSFVGDCFGLEKKDHRARVANLLRAVGLTEDAGRKIGTYSTGMRTRLGIAASLMNDPELLVWDEPTAGLDPISRRQTLDLLEQFRGNKTIVLSSHILGDVDRVCDRLLVLNQGQLLFQGSRGELEDLLPKSLLELRVAGDAAKFRTLIWERMQRKDFSQDGEKIRLELGQSEAAGEMIEHLLKLAKEAGATVVSINSTARQLEDAYLKLVTEDEFRGFLRVKDT